MEENRNLIRQETQADLFRTMPELAGNAGMVDAFADYTNRAEQDIRSIFSTKESVVALMEVLTKEDFRQMRAYLSVITGHLHYLDKGNLEIILDFLADLLAHQSGMVRRIAASAYGYLLAWRQKKYGTSPNENIRKVLFPGTSVSAEERRKINYQIKYILMAFEKAASETAVKHLLGHYAGYFKSSRWDKVTCFYLIMGIIDIPCDAWSNLQKYHIFSFLRNNLPDDNEEVRLAALHLIRTWLSQGWKPSVEIIDYLQGLRPEEEAKFCERCLIAEIVDMLKAEGPSEALVPSVTDIMKLFQENQHSHALWINKILNLSILKEHFFRLKESGSQEHPYFFQYASHLISTLRLNKQAVVFLQAGEDLMEIMPFLESYQKFEIVKDILQSLENVDDYYNFMAPFAGKAFLCLDPADQQELVPRLWELADRPEPMVVNTSLEVVAEIVRNYYKNPEAWSLLNAEEDKITKYVGTSLCSILSTGMASYKPRIAREAFFLTGQVIFGNVELSGERAVTTLLRLVRKALISLNRKRSYAKDFYNYSAALSIAENLRRNEAVITAMEKPGKIAFFSGSFDPFSRAHKAIAREVAEMGYTVYLDAHDFSWYKKLQPQEIRRQIIYLSISDLESVLLFPEEYPISIENPKDLAFLRSLFPGREVTIVADSDMIESCEAYWKEPEPDSIHSFPHIIFQRGAGVSRDLVDPLIKGETMFLRIPTYFDAMSSEEIQKQIALGRDISDMVDYQVKNYVLDKKLYRSEPVYKKMARTRAVDFYSREEMAELMSQELSKAPFRGPEILHSGDKEGQNERDRALYMTEIQDGHQKIVSRVSWHEARSSALYEDCGDYEQTRNLRQYISGNVLVITGIAGEDSQDDAMIVCNELLARYQKEEFSFALCFAPDSSSLTLLKQFGFIPIPGSGESCWYTDLRHPITMFYDVDSFIKEPWFHDPLLRQTIRRGKEKIREILPGLYPGSLILHFDAPVINYRMIKLITGANGVPEHQISPVEEDGTPLSYDSYGEKMCVPFGKLLKGVLIPNTVTRELNIEKLYESDLSSFEIREFPEYEPLVTQIRSVKAFHRPVIFVDDLYHKGFRMEKISRLLKEEDTEPDRFIVGVLSGQGRDLARQRNLLVDAAYFIPDMKAWLVESDFYPFVGGDGIMSDEEKQEGIVGLPSTNLILPYQIPKFLKGSSLTQIYRLSETALENARELFLALEKLYQQKYYHSLTFERIGEVMAEPRYPEGSIAVRHNNQLVSELLCAELGKLRRLRFIHLFDKT